MRRSFPALAFGISVLAVACGGGGGLSVIPHANFGTGSATTGNPAAQRAMVFYIPPAAKQSARKPFYISSGTQSFGVLAVAATSTETPTPQNVQLFPVATPSPCAAASGGGLSCTLNVTAPVGNDIFYVAAFGSVNPGPTAVPLSEFVSGTVNVSLSPGPSPTPLSFTLNGVVYNVTLTVPSPDAGNTPNTQIFAAGTPSATYPLGITAYDSNGNVIASDPTNTFAKPIVISVTPAGAGVVLSLNSATCSSLGSGGASVTVNCAGDINDVAFGYNGMTSPDPNDHVTDTFAIATQQFVSPAPSPATVKLASNVVTWPLTSGEQVYQSLIQRVANGTFVYIAYTASGSVIGTFAPATNTVSAPYPLNSSIASFTAMTISPSGNLWISTSNGLNCWTSVSEAETGVVPDLSNVNPLAFTGDGMLLWGITSDTAGNLWYGGDDAETGQTNIGYAALPNCVKSSTPQAQYTLTNDTYDAGLLTPLSTSNGIAFSSEQSAANDYYGVGLFVVNTSTPSGGVAAYDPIETDLFHGYGTAVDGAGTTYGAFYDTITLASTIQLLPASGSTMSILLTLPPTSSGSWPIADPFMGGAFSPTNGAADRLMYIDEDFAALGLIESVPASPMPILVGLPNAYLPSQPVYNTHGGEYALYVDSNGNLNLARVIPTTTWAVPQTQLASSCNPNGLLAVLERGDSGPFTVSAGSGVTSTLLPGTDHDFWLQYSSVGTTSVQVSAGGRTETYPVAIATLPPAQCDLAHRRQHRH